MSALVESKLKPYCAAFVTKSIINWISFYAFRTWLNNIKNKHNICNIISSLILTNKGGSIRVYGALVYYLRMVAWPLLVEHRHHYLNPAPKEVNIKPRMRRCKYLFLGKKKTEASMAWLQFLHRSLSSWTKPAVKRTQSQTAENTEPDCWLLSSSS
jgi:hypothetical protein